MSALLEKINQLPRQELYGTEYVLLDDVRRVVTPTEAPDEQQSPVGGRGTAKAAKPKTDQGAE